MYDRAGEPSAINTGLNPGIHSLSAHSRYGLVWYGMVWYGIHSGLPQISHKDEIDFGDFKQTTIDVTDVQTKKHVAVEHVWYTTWPDHGVPSTCMSVCMDWMLLLLIPLLSISSSEKIISADRHTDSLTH